jgi:hypothetical protein
VPQLAPHLPGDPQQQDATRQDQAHNLQQLGHDQSEEDPQHQGCDNADQDDLLALLGRQPGGQRADDDRIVAGKHQVNPQDLQERPEHAGVADIGEIGDDLGPEFSHDGVNA